MKTHRHPPLAASPDRSQTRAGLWPRVAAAAVDLLLVSGIAVALLEPVLRLLPESVGFLYRMMVAMLPADQPDGVLEGLRAVSQGMLSLAIVASTYFLTEVFFGRTPGKLVFRLRVHAASEDRVELGARLWRYATKLSPALLLLTGTLGQAQALCRAGEIVGYLTVLGFIVVCGRRRQALHDRIAGTVVRRLPRQARLATLG